MKKIILCAVFVSLSFCVYAEGLGVGLDFRIDTSNVNLETSNSNAFKTSINSGSNYGGDIYYFFNSGLDISLGFGYEIIYSQSDESDNNSDGITDLKKDYFYLKFGFSYAFINKEHIDIGLGSNLKIKTTYDENRANNLESFLGENIETSSTMNLAFNLEFPLILDIKLSRMITVRMKSNIASVTYNYYSLEYETASLNGIFYDNSLNLSTYPFADGINIGVIFRF